MDALSVKTNDDSAALLDRVNEYSQKQEPLRIVGGNTKASLGNYQATESYSELSVANHVGIISYDPTELVVSVRAGTPLEELNRVLSEAGQMLPFDPPEMPGCTIGGILACGLSGIRRPFSGAARDYVLGMRIINGRAEDLSFGGEVMKNVAGYDVSRLQVGAWGTLGVLLDTSMKVLPKPEAEISLCQESDVHDTQAFASLLRQPLPLSGAILIGKRRYLRLSGSESAVKAAAKLLGGEVVQQAAELWSSVRDRSHDFFKNAAGVPENQKTLWRLSVADHIPHTTLASSLSGEWLHDWAGAQRWLVTDEPAQSVFDAASAAGGYATRFAEGAAGDAFQPLSGPMLRLQSRVKESFDPKRILNRGRFHSELDAAFAASSAQGN